MDTLDDVTETPGPIAEQTERYWGKWQALHLGYRVAAYVIAGLLALWCLNFYFNSPSSPEVENKVQQQFDDDQ